MFLGRPARQDDAGFHVQHRHLGLRPEADIKAAALLIEDTGIRERIGRLGAFQHRLGPLRNGGLIFIGGWCQRWGRGGGGICAKLNLPRHRRSHEITFRDAMAEEIGREQ